MKLNINVPFPVNVWVYVFTPVSVSFRQVNVAMILSPEMFAHERGLSTTLAVGVTLSILPTVAVTLPVFPARLLKVKVKLPFPVKV